MNDVVPDIWCQRSQRQLCSRPAAASTRLGYSMSGEVTLHGRHQPLRVGLTLIDMGEAEPYAIIIHTNPSGVPSAARASLGQLDLPR